MSSICAFLSSMSHGNFMEYFLFVLASFYYSCELGCMLAKQFFDRIRPAFPQSYRMKYGYWNGTGWSGHSIFSGIGQKIDRMDWQEL